VGSCSARCLSCGTVGQLELHPAAREEAGSELPCGTWPHPTARHRSRGETFCGRRVGTWHRPAHLIWFPCLPCERSAFTAFQERRRKPAFGAPSGRRGRRAGGPGRRGPGRNVLPGQGASRDGCRPAAEAGRSRAASGAGPTAAAHRSLVLLSGTNRGPVRPSQADAARGCVRRRRLAVPRCRCSVKMSSPRGYQSRRARERTGPRAEGVPSGAGVGVECFCDVAAVVGCPSNTSCRSSLLATQLGGDTFTDQLEG